MGFGGRRGSRKSTIAKLVSKALGWTYASFGDYVRHLARERGQPESLPVLQEIGGSLVKRNRIAFCRSVLSHAGWQPGQNVVIDGIRHKEVADVLCSLVAPMVFKLVFVDTPDDIRSERLKVRGEHDSYLLRETERHSTEAQTRHTIPAVAHLVVDGTELPQQLADKITAWIREQG